MYDGMALCEGDSCLGMGVGCRGCRIQGVLEVHMTGARACMCIGGT